MEHGISDLLLEIIRIGGYLILLPMVINFKYFFQTRIRDYLLVTLYFLVGYIGLLPEVTLMAINWPEGLGVVYTGRTILFLGKFQHMLGFLIAVRVKWSKPPISEKMIIIFFSILAVVDLLLPNYFVGVWYIGQYISTPLLIFRFGFMFWAFSTTNLIESNNWRIVGSKYLWMGSTAAHGIQHTILLFTWLLPDRQFIGTTPLGIAFFSLFIIGQALLLTLHIFFPEAVLLSHEQIHRARKIYKTIGEEIPIFNIGMKTIHSYIEEAIAAVEEGESIKVVVDEDEI